MKALNILSHKYKIMIGVGGIGSGQFFVLNGNHTLGREESRSGHFLDKNDYCKLHIISHYVKTLLGQDFKVFPIGKVGNDEPGKRLLQEMNEAGISTEYVKIDKTKPTLFSFCFLYSDLSGGNMTTDDSACSEVDENFVSATEKEFQKFSGTGVALAVPEVSLSARLKLLDIALMYNFFKVASFTSEEMREVIDNKVLSKVDLLCVNLDEAESAVKNVIKSPTTIPRDEAQNIVECAVKLFLSENPNILISITHGKNGSFIWDGTDISYVPSLQVTAVSTAGAGDAFTSGLIAGLTAGLTLKESQHLATLTGAGSVLSPHTINKDLDRVALSNLLKNSNLKLTENIYKLIEE